MGRGTNAEKILTKDSTGSGTVFSTQPAMIDQYNRDDDYAKLARLYIPASLSKFIREDFKRDHPLYKYFIANGMGGYAPPMTTFDENLSWSRSGPGWEPIQRNDSFKQGYLQFLLTNINTTDTEKMQVVDVLSDSYAAYFFGQAPSIYTFGGKLYNTKHDQWKLQMLRSYANLLRGTQTASHQSHIFIAFDNEIISGSLTNLAISYSGETEIMLNFSFSMLVKDRIVSDNLSDKQAFEVLDNKVVKDFLEDGQFLSEDFTIRKSSDSALDNSILVSRIDAALVELDDVKKERVLLGLKDNLQNNIYTEVLLIDNSNVKLTVYNNVVSELLTGIPKSEIPTVDILTIASEPSTPSIADGAF